MKEPKRLKLTCLQSMQGRDGIAWTAKVYFDKKHVGDIRDEGNGGGLWGEFYIGPKGIETEIREYCNSLYELSDDAPFRKYDKEVGKTNGCTWKDNMFDYVFEEMANEIDRKKLEASLKRKAKNNTLFRIRTPEGKIIDYKLSGGPYNPRVRKRLDDDYPSKLGTYPNGQLIWIYGVGDIAPKEAGRRQRGPCVL